MIAVMTTMTIDHELAAAIQRGWDALASGDPGPALAMMSDDIVMENGPVPLPQPWLRVEGRDAIAATLESFGAIFGTTFRQHGHCVYADGRIGVSVVRDEADLPSGERYEGDVVAVMRFDDDSRIDRLWFVEVDVEKVAILFASIGSTT
jgi:ketosteroid isomerase-like protein